MMLMNIIDNRKLRDVKLPLVGFLLDQIKRNTMLKNNN